MTNADKDPRPKYLNLLQIRLPVTGIVSIAHRLSGVLLVISIPAGIYLLQHSLGGPDEFSSLSGFFSSSAVRLVLLLIVMAVAYHLFAGIRFLLIDLGVGEHLPAARRGAWSVVGATAIAFLLALFVVI
ncbi:MAG: succinate dehydrogenase, cytochrome b556 subunit [Gammaproteobacteria bacterium]|nr:succinate dehydrogenase, cytochrome b556 subunit [Gammaproteobacteria bacterium]